MIASERSPSGTYALKLRIGEERISVVLQTWDEVPEAPHEVMLRLDGLEQPIEERDSRGYFQALCAIRARLEQSGMLIECYGGSENVYPSPLMESMGYGGCAYRLSPGRAARKADIVQIFDSGPDVVPTSVQAQKEYYEKWLKSLR